MGFKALEIRNNPNLWNLRTTNRYFADTFRKINDPKIHEKRKLVEETCQKIFGGVFYPRNLPLPISSIQLFDNRNWKKNNPWFQYETRKPFPLCRTLRLYSTRQPRYLANFNILLSVMDRHVDKIDFSDEFTQMNERTFSVDQCDPSSRAEF